LSRQHCFRWLHPLKNEQHPQQGQRWKSQTGYLVLPDAENFEKRRAVLPPKLPAAGYRQQRDVLRENK
jgi:hypothetical protein